MLARARVRITPAIWPLLKTARSELSGRIAGPAPTQPRPRRGRSCSSPSTPGGGQGGNGAGGGRDQTDTSDTPQTLKMLVGIAAGASLLGGFLNIRAYERRRRREAEHGGGAEGDVKLLKGPAFGKPALGGDFTLINQDNKVTRNSDLHGAWALLYFGFTYCPDICPNELTRLQEILSRLDAENRGKDVQPVFITIDPERDGPAQLKDYLADWHPRLIGLTGSPAQIQDCCKKFRVYANKSVLGDKPDEYLIDHSVMFYLVNPKGEFVDYYGANLSAADIAARIGSEMRAFG